MYAVCKPHVRGESVIWVSDVNYKKNSAYAAIYVG